MSTPKLLAATIVAAASAVVLYRKPRYVALQPLPEPKPYLPPRVIADIDWGVEAARIIVAEDARQSSMREHPSQYRLTEAEHSESERLLRRVFPEVGS